MPTPHIFPSIEALQPYLQSWRIKSDSIVFTNGCFDLLHSGHLFVLEEAAKLGKRLVVGINTDQSISRLKGAQRPIMPLADRMTLVAALRCVDAVVAFDTPTPEELIHAISPDVLVKGGDYTPDTIVGASWVKANGGDVAIIPLIPGISTTAILGKILKMDHPRF
jgi:rfaE bifunctional protein nucleotidyltransferase chain/domain